MVGHTYQTANVQHHRKQHSLPRYHALVHGLISYMDPKSCAFNSELLASVAVVAWPLMFGCAQKCQSTAGADIAVKLRFISEALQSQSIYQLSSEIQQLSHGALQDLLKICTVCASLLLQIPTAKSSAVLSPSPDTFHAIQYHRGDFPTYPIN